MPAIAIKQAFGVDGTHGHDNLEHVLPKGHGMAGQNVEKVLKC